MFFSSWAQNIKLHKSRLVHFPQIFRNESCIGISHILSYYEYCELASGKQQTLLPEL
jgi:hypothetical protein